MDSSDAIGIYKKLINDQIKVWFDGGWGVDALLGQQTRNHGDLDIVVQEKDIKKLREIFDKNGYKEVKRDDSSEYNFVLGNGKLLLDIHVVTFDEKGNGIYGPKEKGIFYPAYAFGGKGLIDDYPVDCLTAEYQIESHNGYELDENDFKDVSALCKKFGIKLPEEYQKLASKVIK